MNASIFGQRQDKFVLWRSAHGTPPPALVIGQLQPGAPVSLAGQQRFDLTPSAQFPDLWMIEAGACNLADGQIYYYWFEVTDAHPNPPGPPIQVTHPMAVMVAWRAPPPPPARPRDRR